MSIERDSSERPPTKGTSLSAASTKIANRFDHSTVVAASETVGRGQRARFDRRRFFSVRCRGRSIVTIDRKAHRRDRALIARLGPEIGLQVRGMGFSDGAPGARPRRTVHSGPGMGDRADPYGTPPMQRDRDRLVTDTGNSVLGSVHDQRPND
jgi:hypothetical protein